MEIREALTFDDVLLEPAESAILPHQASTATRVTRNPPASRADSAEMYLVATGFRGAAREAFETGD